MTLIRGLMVASFFAAALQAVAAQDPIPTGNPTPLFNGKDLDGWTVEGKGEYVDKSSGKTLPIWSVKDGNLYCDGNGYGFLRYNKQEFGDFGLTVDYRMISPKKTCNSGIGIRTVPYDPKRGTETRPAGASYEIQLLDDAGTPPSKGGNASLYQHVAPKVNAAKPSPEWNTLEITCVGPQIKIRLNGELVIDYDQTTNDKTKDKPLKGYICLQNHGGKLEFRNLRVQELKAK